MASDTARYKPLAITFFLSSVSSIVIGVSGPRFLGLSSKPAWMAWTHLALGLVAVATVPFAWRWLYNRGAG